MDVMQLGAAPTSTFFSFSIDNTSVTDAQSREVGDLSFAITPLPFILCDD
jgi:hypothetical protein